LPAPLPPHTVALVTGASSGIGEAIARAIAARGPSRLVLVARRADRLARLVAELGSCAVARPTDLTDPAQVAALIAAEPRVDLLVNSAGYGWSSDVVDQCREAPRLERMIDLNCRAVVSLTCAWLPGMQERRRGWILNVGSIAGMMPMPTVAVYAATKAFVHSFSEGLRVELRGTGVAVHLLAPGPVDTEFFSISHPGLAGRPLGPLFAKVTPMAERAVRDLLADRPFRVPGPHLRLGMGLASSLPWRLWRPLVRHTLRRAGSMVTGDDGA